MQIICGNPEDQSATYTMFVLPFSYSPEEYESASEHYYHPISASIQRQNYFSPEIADVLFHRAKWFQLDGPHVSEFRMAESKDGLKIRIHKPRIVLFEWPLFPGRGSTINNNHDPLRLGFLIVTLSFSEQQSRPPVLADLMELNDKFRYWHVPFDNFSTQADPILGNCPPNLLQTAITSESTTSPMGPEHRYLERWASLLRVPIKLDDEGPVWSLFPKTWDQEAREWVQGNNRKHERKGWLVSCDGRAYVWTCATTQHGAKGASQSNADLLGHWIKLLNVDAPMEDPGKYSTFEQNWSNSHTYRRWEEEGTLYGFSHQCGAMLAPQISDPPIWRHFGEMYFDQTMLLLFLRIGLFSYSQWLSRISARVRDSNRQGFFAWHNEFQEIRWSFTQFTNLYHFPVLFTSQEQGIEMYRLATGCLDLTELFDEIQKEIHSTHEYLELRTEQEQSQTTIRLTWVATAGLVGALSTGFLGMNIFAERLKAPTWHTELFRFLLCTLVWAGIVLVMWALPALRKLR